MTSRLDRLFVLLEAGAGGATRRAAARQLGEIQKARPEELHRLLGRLMKHLRSPAWETRVAASQAVEAILSNVPEWHPSPLAEVKEEKVEEDTSRLRCETFDIERVLQYGAHLMGSEGREYDFDDDTIPGAESLAKQRQLLNSRLGLDVASKLGVDLTNVYTNDDLCPVKVAPVKTETRRPVQELMPVPSIKPLSSREMNLAKRKARQAFCKQKSRDCSEEPSTPPAEPTCKKIKLEPVDEVLVESTGPVPDASGAWGEAPRWPLEGWCGALQGQLFGAAWEARHGAASALRELLRARIANTAGYRPARTPLQNEDAHQEWLEDMALRLLCVLALDRFGDFVSDQVVAPVRETCAQTLGVALAQMRAERVRQVAALLGSLTRQPQWEARHGALLGFKYLLCARQDVACECGALEYLISALDDPAEDVSAVAAGALAPAAAALADARPQQLPQVVARLWQLLHDQDDLASPANSYMALLASLMALPKAAKLIHPIDLTDVLPRLWPYLDHSTSSVRKATLQTLRTLTRPLITESPSPPTNGKPHDDHSSDKHNSDSKNSVKASDSQVDSDSVNSEVNSVKNGYLNWTPELLQEAMRHVYQRVLFEHVHEIQEIALQVWENFVHHAPLSTILLASCPMLATWLCLAMQPARLHVDPALLVHATPKEKRVRPGQWCESEPPPPRPAQKWYLGGGGGGGDAQAGAQRDDHVMRARVKAAHMLGYLSCYLVQPAPGIEYKPEDESPIDCYVKVMVVYLRSSSALQRLVASLVIAAWARREWGGRAHKHTHTDTLQQQLDEEMSALAPPLLSSTLQTSLNQALYYDEVALNCTRVLQDARDLHAMMKHYKLPVDGEQFNNIVRLEQVSQLTRVSQPLVAGMKSKRVSQTLEERRSNLDSLFTACSRDQNTLNVSVQAALASACTYLRILPEKLNPVVRPLMESVKREPCEELQNHSADTLAALLEQLAGREPCPNNKVLVNLKAFLRCDPEHTPRISLEKPEENGESGSDSGNEGNANKSGIQGPTLDKYDGILTLWEQERGVERGAPRRGRPPAAHAHAHAHALTLQQPAAVEDESRRFLRIQRRGATLALTSLTKYFGEELPGKLPKLWEFITEPFDKVMTDAELETLEMEPAEELISRLQVLEVVCGHLGGGVWAAVRAGCGACLALTRCQYTAARHMAARAAAAMAARDPATIMHTAINQLIPALSDVRSERTRCGAAETLSRIVDVLQLQIVPYIVLLVVPLMGRMSDHCEAVRVMSTRCFASLIQLMPLDGAVPEPAGLSPDLRARRARDKHFLDQLFNPKTIKDYKIPVPVSAELRSYQQAGVNWLRFLYEFKLHGVLCDDMGLGKTLQSIVVVAGSHWERALSKQPALPSLVVCPPTLTGHWLFEVSKFIGLSCLKPLQYVGPPAERERLRGVAPFYNLIVASYDIVRKDIHFFSQMRWNYCVLDEGHVIKNGKTKAFKAIKQLVANHRLILSGTPIQNNVLELWSLFDFLMPGLLGTERQFTARYSRPILQARDPRATPQQLQAGALAVEALHRQVLPFLLRRVKEDVLKELPPKITQDYYCELSPLQRSLYEQFSKHHMPQHIDQSAHTHVFQALHYLQNVCNHPKLVLTAEHPETSAVQQQLAARGSSLDDIDHSAKLPALKQLLLDCGIGTTSSEPDSQVVVSQHRALIFCQLKKMLDIVERDLLQKHLPAVSYLRLDGAVPPPQRHTIVTRFNTDVSIDCLLLTTQVGGLGLNLTGADTVIFVEHDWNPMKDLQAMDRAHRIGQKKVVNVYRLVTRDTLEEKIMGLQKFKLQTANTVISSENAAMETMGTEQLLDLFQLSAPPGPAAPAASTSSVTSPPADALPDLWDDKQYEEEYDMTNFIKGLNKMNA